MKKPKLSSEEEMKKRREQIAEEVGEDVMDKLLKAMTVLAAAMIKRAEYRAQAQLRCLKSKTHISPESGS